MELVVRGGKVMVFSGGFGRVVVFSRCDKWRLYSPIEYHYIPQSIFPPSPNTSNFDCHYKPLPNLREREIEMD